MSSESSRSFPLFGFLTGVATLVLVVLKLAGIGAVATWPWLAVLSPILVYVALSTLVMVVGLVVVAIAAFFVSRNR